MKPTVAVNNTVYEIHGSSWWDEDAGFDVTSLRFCMNPVRFGWFREKLAALNPPGSTVLDVGCGGGFLAEEFSKEGYVVTGIDPAAASVEAAKRHAASTGLQVDYHVGRGESLPFAAGSFAVVACCDVLEHVDDLAQVVGEVVRVLKPGGIFLYDTVNRTFKSKIVLIKVLQDWGLGGMPEPNIHVWEKFIRPAELMAIFVRNGLVPGEMVGISTRHNPFSMMRWMRAIRKGRVANDNLPEAMGLQVSRDVSLSYMGYARKPEMAAKGAPAPRH